MLVLIVGLGAVSVVYISATQSSSDQLARQNQQISALKLQLEQLVAAVNNGKGSGNINSSLPPDEPGPDDQDDNRNVVPVSRGTSRPF